MIPPAAVIRILRPWTLLSVKCLLRVVPTSDIKISFSCYDRVSEQGLCGRKLVAGFSFREFRLRVAVCFAGPAGPPESPRNKWREVFT